MGRCRLAKGAVPRAVNGMVGRVLRGRVVQVRLQLPTVSRVQLLVFYVVSASGLSLGLETHETVGRLSRRAGQAVWRLETELPDGRGCGPGQSGW